MVHLATRVWYGDHPLSYALLPLSWLYCGIVGLRRLAYRKAWLRTHRLPVPVIVVGNLTVGGTGKTPLVLWVTDLLRRHNHQPGILIRGYGGHIRQPQLVNEGSDPHSVGDEAILLARRSGCPVVVGADRVAAGERLVTDCGCGMIVSDDGLQHYRLGRDLELLVVDASRRFGNGHCLPAGPLREPAARRHTADLIICNGGPYAEGAVMHVAPERLVNLGDRRITRSLEMLRRQRVTAVAGIGNPDRFFNLLRHHGLYVHERPYPDHHAFNREDAASWPPGPVIMTEKDAVKCTDFARPDFWYLSVTARLRNGFEQLLTETLKGIGNG